MKSEALKLSIVILLIVGLCIDLYRRQIQQEAKEKDTITELITPSNSKKKEVEVPLVKDTINEVPFTYGELIDERDGQRYPTVFIGDRQWMAADLNHESLLGHSITKNGKRHYWYSGKKGLFSSTLEDDLFPSKIKELFNFYICPKGWHIPTMEEWMELIKLYNPNAKEDFLVSEKVGEILQESALNLTTNGRFDRKEERLMNQEIGYYLTSTPYDEERFWYFYVNQDKDAIYRFYTTSDWAFSCRCVVD